MASSPAFAATPKIGIAKPTVANTNRDGTGTMSTIITGAANGTRVDRIEIESSGASGAAAAANVLRLYLHDGVNAFLFREIAVATFTPSGTAAGFSTIIKFDNDHPCVLPSTYSLRCAPHTRAGTQDDYVWSAFAADI